MALPNRIRNTRAAIRNRHPVPKKSPAIAWMAGLGFDILRLLICRMGAACIPADAATHLPLAAIVNRFGFRQSHLPCGHVAAAGFARLAAAVVGGAAELAAIAAIFAGCAAGGRTIAAVITASLGLGGCRWLCPGPNRYPGQSQRNDTKRKHCVTHDQISPQKECA